VSYEKFMKDLRNPFDSEFLELLSYDDEESDVALRTIIQGYFRKVLGETPDLIRPPGPSRPTVTRYKLMNRLNGLDDALRIQDDRITNLERASEREELGPQESAIAITSRASALLALIEGVENAYVVIDEMGLTFHVVVRPGMFAKLIERITQVEMEITSEFQREAIHFWTHDSRAFNPEEFEGCMALLHEGVEQSEHIESSHSTC
jgi:hypothetical protein